MSSLASNGVVRCEMTETVAECRLFDPAQFYPCDLWQCSISFSAPNKAVERKQRRPCSREITGVEIGNTADLRRQRFRLVIRLVTASRLATVIAFSGNYLA